MTLPHPFRLELPAGDPFTGIARDVARRYAEVLGAGGDDAEAFGAAVAKAIETAGAHTAVELAFDAPPGAIEVRVQGGGHSAVIRRELTARQA